MKTKFNLADLPATLREVATFQHHHAPALLAAIRAELARMRAGDIPALKQAEAELAAVVEGVTA